MRTMKTAAFAFAVIGLASSTVNAEGYQHGWKVYENPQPGYTYGPELNPYGPGGSESYGPGGGTGQTHHSIIIFF